MSEEREVEDEGISKAAAVVVVFVGAPVEGILAVGRDEGAAVVADDSRGVKGAAPLLM